MDFLYSDDTIIACSSGQNSNQAISVIRISGFKSLNELDGAFSIKAPQITPRFAHFCKIVDGLVVIDEIVLVFFESPRSYNGENIIELSVHGNVLNVERIIKLFVDKFNCRQAQPGEFSYRAMRNNKLSLAQIEGLDLLLNANSNFMLSQGFSLMSGSLQKEFEQLQATYLRHKSALELGIDFLDDVGEEGFEEQKASSFLEFHQVCDSLFNKVTTRSSSLMNPEIVLFGLPNAGKSTLFNTLLEDNRAIVSDIAGTTRDFISESIKINGVIYRLIDTAGLRASDDEFETEGIKKAEEIIEKSFFKILVFNPLLQAEVPEGQYDLIVFTHSDLDGFQAKKVGPMGVIKNGSIGPVLEIGMNNKDESKALVFDRVSKKYLEKTRNNPILVQRQVDTLSRLSGMGREYRDLLAQSEDITILSHELNSIGHCVSELIGIVSPDDVLHNIFNNFCIGK